jgi:hypothetical protein
MSGLKSLKFAPIPRASTDPTAARRSKVVERLLEQKLLVEQGPQTRTVQRWTKKDGERVAVEKKVKVHPWWRTDEKGQVFFFVRYGGRPIEFEKGKAGIAAGSRDQLKGVIDTLVAAIEAGELDQILAQASKSRVVGKKRAA